ncbi:LysR family transcriptional regulator [Dyella caseinilytica]|uniref:LysR family transcriptional regulator n=1 Tax=Dyella caseinilytica TaxID=1849581 RepID=A0ABX7GPN3_9GAMM|nr:LysR family transcriptional regulator [Dyella caseinilytica]QRN52274.1 LysR family transcriptional regulator [Dyella caseinilytica]GGA14531.1 LysR family transcriptional regulator [Dyella caseinilytica]
MDLIRQLRIFVTVAETRNFSRASDMLRMARPGITKAISELEASLGARLLHRTTRRVSLTGEGESLYERATGLLSDAAAIRNLFGGSEEHPAGRLRVDVPVAVAKPLLIPALPEFSAAYPDIEIILGVSDQPVDLVADAIDCVLRIGALPVTSMIARQLATITMVICASPNYLSAHGTPRRLEELARHKAVNYFSGRGHRAIQWHMPKHGEKHELAVPSTMMVNDAEALVACALEGMGLIQVPELLVSEHLANGRLIHVLPSVCDDLWPLSIMYPNRQYLAPQVRVFIDWVARLVERKRGAMLHPI